MVQPDNKSVVSDSASRSKRDASGYVERNTKAIRGGVLVVNYGSMDKINAFIERFRTIQENSNVFGNDNQNNFKLYTIKCLSIIKERLKNVRD